jgi:hypothetical protein
MRYETELAQVPMEHEQNHRDHVLYLTTTPIGHAHHWEMVSRVHSGQKRQRLVEKRRYRLTTCN